METRIRNFKVDFQDWTIKIGVAIVHTTMTISTKAMTGIKQRTLMNRTIQVNTKTKSITIKNTEINQKGKSINLISIEVNKEMNMIK